MRDTFELEEDEMEVSLDLGLHHHQPFIQEQQQQTGSLIRKTPLKKDCVRE